MEDEGDAAILAKAALIREKNLRLKRLARSKKILKNRPQLPRTAGLQKFSAMKQSLQDNKLDTSAIESRARSRRPEASRERGQDVVMRAQSSSRAPSQMPRRDRSEGGLSTVGERTRAEKVQRLQQRERNRMARASESDRHIADTKPKHLFAGKSGIGSARSR
jgi:nucleolar GTP-binding protein